jgi:hypothetical protein
MTATGVAQKNTIQLSFKQNIFKIKVYGSLTKYC